MILYYIMILRIEYGDRTTQVQYVSRIYTRNSNDTNVHYL